MFGSLTKLADKAFVIGFLLPTLIASMTFLYLLNDVEPFKAAYEAALGIKAFSELTIAALVIWAIASLLMMWNEWQYRFLEGYVGPFKNESWRGKAKTRMLKERADLKARAPILDDADASAAEKQQYLKALREFYKRFPIKPELVLPTRFGNVIRAFETYPYDVYGVEAIPTWLRLQGVVPKEYAALINDTRSAVDFFVNVWFLGGAIAVLAVVRGVFVIHVDCCGVSIVSAGLWKFAAVGAAGAIAVYISYAGAIATAASWGDSVKAAFDLYLPTLAKQMGYQLPKEDSERRELWDEVNSLFLYRTPIDAARWAASEPAPNPEATEAKAKPGEEGEGKEGNDEEDKAD